MRVQSSPCSYLRIEAATWKVLGSRQRTTANNVTESSITDMRLRCASRDSLSIVLFPAASVIHSNTGGSGFTNKWLPKIVSVVDWLKSAILTTKIEVNRKVHVVKGCSHGDERTEMKKEMANGLLSRTKKLKMCDLSSFGENGIFTAHTNGLFSSHFLNLWLGKTVMVFSNFCNLMLLIALSRVSYSTTLEQALLSTISPSCSRERDVWHL